MLDFGGWAVEACHKPKETAFFVGVILGCVFFAQLGLALMRHVMRRPHSIIDAVSQVIVFVTAWGLEFAVISFLGMVVGAYLRQDEPVKTTAAVVFLVGTLTANGVIGFMQFRVPRRSAAAMFQEELRREEVSDCHSVHSLPGLSIRPSA